MIAGVTRVRNEEPNLEKVLDHVSTLVDKIYAYDDASTDATPDILAAHAGVTSFRRGKEWASDPIGRRRAEGNLRQIPYEMAVADGAEWVYYFDGDEILVPDLSHGPSWTLMEDDPTAHMVERGIMESKYPLHVLAKANQFQAYQFQLYDFYITAEDVDKQWHERVWMGPEFRRILMFFKVMPGIRFHDRVPSGLLGVQCESGWVKHYGKAISVEEWERSCNYYVNNRGGDTIPMFTNKWEKRKGKAIHTVSDFGSPLIKWEERTEKGFILRDPDVMNATSQ